MYLWDLRNDHNEQLEPMPGVSIQHVDIDPVGTMLAAVSNKGQCFVWNIVSGQALNAAAAAAAAASLAASSSQPLGGEMDTANRAGMMLPLQGLFDYLHLVWSLIP